MFSLRAPVAIACSLVTMIPVAVRADPSNPATLPAGTCTSKRAVISIVGRIASARQASYTVAVLASRASGDALIAQARAQEEAMENVRRLSGDPKALQAYELRREQKIVDETTARANQPASQQPPAPASLMSGVQIRVAKDGSFRCDGVAQGSYDVIASVARTSGGTDPTSPASFSSVIYAARVDVPAPPRGRRLIVEANTFTRQFAMGR